jgi:hypothetical protein
MLKNSCRCSNRLPLSPPASITSTLKACKSNVAGFLGQNPILPTNSHIKVRYWVNEYLKILTHQDLRNILIVNLLKS